MCIRDSFRLRFSATAIPFVSAAGELLCVYLVFKEDKEEAIHVEFTEKTLESDRGKVVFFPFTTKTSYVDRKTFADIIRRFMAWYRGWEPGLDVILVGDNLGAYKNAGLAAEAFRKHFYMSFLLDNTTHWSQPLDWVLFGRLKKFIRILVEEEFFDSGLIKDKQGPSPIDILTQAFLFAFTAPAIKLAFEDTGLVPFNPEKIKSLAAEHHHMEDLALGKCLSDAKARQQQYVDDIVASALPKMIERSKRRREAGDASETGG